MTIPPVEALSRDEKIGQLFLAGFPGTEVPEAFGALVAEHHLGNAILFGRNVATPPQVASLTGTLRQRMTDAVDVPPLVGIDQEGGIVSRLDWGTTIPGAMSLGAGDDPALARRAGRAVGAELATLGVNLNLAPVLDVNDDPDNPVIGVRSFGATPARVADLGAAFAAGLDRADVLPCGKHFPGHGSTTVDSHIALPVLEHGRERLDAVELVPFRRAVAADIGAVMIGHLAVPALTGHDRPASVSEAVVTGLLREELGYDGLVVTDCFEMDAIVDGVGTADAAVQAIQAGCDLITVSHTPERQRAALDAVRDAVATGRITDARLTEAAERVLEAKRHVAHGRPFDAGDWAETAACSRTVARDVAAAGVTVIRDDESRLPIPVDGRIHVLEFAGSRASPASAERDRSGQVPAAIAGMGPTVTTDVVDAGAAAGDAQWVADATPDADRTVVCTVDAVDTPGQIAVVDALRSAGHEPVVAALRSPYDAGQVPDQTTVLATYDRTTASIRAAAAILTGMGPATGRLPVGLPRADR